MGLFDFLKKNDFSISSPVSGFCADITKCKDKTFSSKMLGDGFIVVPTSEIICSPCEGTVSMFFPTLHSFGITMNNGQQVLVHIGIDTVNLNGKLFEKLLDSDYVKKGTPVVRFNYTQACQLGYDPTVIVIMVNKDSIEKRNLNRDVKSEEIIIEENK